MPEITTTKSLVINTRHGGYGLSDAASRELARRKGIALRTEEGHLFVGETSFERLADVISRDDADLIAVVREMGDAANGSGAILRVVDVAITLEINDDDGLETVAVYRGTERKQWRK